MLRPHKIVFDDAVERGEAVSPRYLFAFAVVTTVIRDWEFVDPASQLRYLRGNLGFKPKTVFFDGDLLEYIAPEHLVTRFHVGEVQVRQHIGKERQELITNRMPEK